MVKTVDESSVIIIKQDFFMLPPPPKLRAVRWRSRPIGQTV